MKQYVYGLALLAGIVFCTYVPSQADFWLIFTGFIIAFSGYLGFLNQNEKQVSWRFLMITGLVMRLAIIASFPNLSDDIYRFFWDAKVLSKGISPYAYLPIEIANIIGEQDIYALLNSKEYYSVYPPLNQLMYYLASMFTNQIHIFAIFLRLEYLLFDVAGLWFLYRLICYFHLSKWSWTAYAFNPLVVIEGLGNLHIEIVMTAFLIGAIYFAFAMKKWVVTAFYFSAAVGVKLVPLLVGPFLFFRWGKQTFLKLILWSVMFTFLFLGPIVIGLDLDTFAQSLDLYFRKFEFNASFYYLFREVGFLFLGYNLIAYLGPILGIITLIGILYLAFRSQKAEFHKWIEYVLVGWTIYLLFATIIHPWYIIPLILLSSLSYLRYPITWSFLIILTYSSYQNIPFKENVNLVAIEYLILGGYIIYEWKRRRQEAIV